MSHLRLKSQHNNRLKSKFPHFFQKKQYLNMVICPPRTYSERNQGNSQTKRWGYHQPQESTWGYTLSILIRQNRTRRFKQHQIQLLTYCFLMDLNQRKRPRKTFFKSWHQHCSIGNQEKWKYRAMGVERCFLGCEQFRCLPPRICSRERQRRKEPAKERLINPEICATLQNQRKEETK